MGGSKKLFDDLLLSEIPSVRTRKAGRSQELYAMRNELLVHRHYYYVFHTDKRYNAIMNILSHEFHLQVFTIQKHLSECHAMLKDLEKRKPARGYFKKKWPHWVW